MLLSLHYFNCYIYMVGEIKQSDGTTFILFSFFLDLPQVSAVSLPFFLTQQYKSLS